MMKNFFFLMAGMLILPCLLAASPTLTVEIVNNRTDVDGNKIYIQPDKQYLYNMQSGQKTYLSPGVSVKLSSLPLKPGTSNTYLAKIDQTMANSALRLYFSISPNGDNILPNNPGGEHAPNDPNMASVRYDFIEASVDGTSTACVNLSSLEQLGIAMAMQTSNGGKPVASAGWKSSLNTVAAALGKISPNAVVGKIGTNSFVRVKGPHLFPNLWDISKIFPAVNNQSITIIGYYVGSNQDTQAGAFNLTGTFVSTGPTTSIALTGTFTDISGTSHPATMKVSNINPVALYQATQSNGCNSVCTLDGQAVSRAADLNDKWQFVFNFLMTGFNAGFWTNSSTLNTVNWNLDNEFLPTEIYNQYSAQIFYNSDSYGDPYSDNVPGNKVQLNLAQGLVDTLTITILGDDDTMGFAPRTAQIKGMQVSCTSGNGLNQIIFNNDASTATPVVDGVATIPPKVNTNAYNTMALLFNTNTLPADLTKLPQAQIYIPANVMTFIPASYPAKCPGWTSSDGVTTGLFTWQPVANSNIYWNLCLSNDVVPKNYNPNPAGVKYLLVCPSNSPLQGIIVGTGAMIPVASGQAVFPFPSSPVGYTKLSLVFDKAAPTHPYLWLYPPNLQYAGWHITGNDNDNAGMFTWSALSGGPYPAQLSLSGDVIKANFDASKASKNPPPVKSGGI